MARISIGSHSKTVIADELLKLISSGYKLYKLAPLFSRYIVGNDCVFRREVICEPFARLKKKECVIHYGEELYYISRSTYSALVYTTFIYLFILKQCFLKSYLHPAKDQPANCFFFFSQSCVLHGLKFLYKEGEKNVEIKRLSYLCQCKENRTKG